MSPQSPDASASLDEEQLQALALLLQLLAVRGRATFCRPEEPPPTDPSYDPLSDPLDEPFPEEYR